MDEFGPVKIKVGQPSENWPILAKVILSTMHWMANIRCRPKIVQDALLYWFNSDFRQQLAHCINFSVSFGMGVVCFPIKCGHAYDWAKRKAACRILCLSESQRKLLDGIGYSCKDKVECLLLECSGYDRSIRSVNIASRTCTERWWALEQISLSPPSLSSLTIWKIASSCSTEVFKAGITQLSKWSTLVRGCDISGLDAFGVIVKQNIAEQPI